MSASERKIAQLEDENFKLREQLTKIAGGSDTLEMESGVNKDLDAFITVRWGAEVAQMSPHDARQHGLRMLEVAEAAEADAALITGMRKLDFEEQVSFALLRLIRENRAEAT